MFEWIDNLVYNLKQKLYVNKLNPALVSAIVAYLVITPIDATLYIQWLNSMTNYKWVAGGLIYPFFGLLFFAIPTAWKMWQNDLNTNCPVGDLAKIGLMDSLSSIMAALTIPFISIMLNVIVSKLVLPMTMIASYFVLRKKYLWTHYAGVLITIFGVLSAAVPKFVYETDSPNGTAMFFFVCSLIPGVASYIIKEMYLKENPDADSWYMNTIISVFQVAIGFITLPLVMLPIPGLGVNPEHFGTYIGNALKCQLGGINSEEGDDCRFSFMYLILFQLFGTAANILMFTIIREGSSVIFIMINTLKTPITALMGYFLIYYNVIKFSESESFVLTWLDVVSLVFVLIGSVFYAMNGEKKADEIDYDAVDTKDENNSSMHGKHKLLNPLLILDDDEENTIGMVKEHREFDL